MEPGLPAPKPASRKRPTNKSMPATFQEGAIWKASVVPSMIKWAGTYPKVFKIPVNALIPILEVVCRHYYEDEALTFDSKHVVVVQVCIQCIS